MTKGTSFTWSNGRLGAALTEKRLDRVICNDQWLSFWDSFACCSLTRSMSDHFPILISLLKGVITFPSSFKFLKMWTNHEECRKIIAEVWSTQVHGCPMSILSQKLKLVKLHLRSWNKHVLGDVNLNVDKAQGELDAILAQGSTTGYSDVLVSQEKAAQLNL